MLLQVFVAFPANSRRRLRLLARVAPRIDIFAIGFPVTLGVGLLGMLLTLPALTGPFTMALERMLANFR